MKIDSFATSKRILSIRLRREKNVLFLWCYLAIFCIAQYITVTTSSYIGILINIMVLFALYFHAAVLHRREIKKVYLACSLIPLIKIIEYTIPPLKVNAFYWHLIIGLPLLMAVIWVIKINQYTTASLGLKRGNVLAQIVFGLYLGAILGLVNFMILRPIPLVKTLNIGSVLMSAIILAFFMGFLVDLIFRGLLYRMSARIIGHRFGIFYSSAAYACMFITYMSPINIFISFLYAVLLAMLVKHFDSLLGSSLTQATASISFYLILPSLL